jgi:uncharacterized protein YndB with AHSA1/START domain/uncharacterized damage-inducible protein DinB
LEEPENRRGDHATLRLETIVRSTVEEAYAAFTDPKLLSIWFTEAAKADLRVGGRYSNADGDKGEFLALAPPHRLEFTWENPKHCPDTRVRVSFRNDSVDHVKIVLEHSELKTPSDESDMRGGWSWALDSLRSYLETGKPIPHEQWLEQQDTVEPVGRRGAGQTREGSMLASLKPLSEISKLSTDLVLNCLEGLSEADARMRPLGECNSIAFLLAHISDARCFLSNLLGCPIDSPFEKELGNVTGIDEAKSLPPLSVLRDAWRSISDHLEACFESVAAETLAEKSRQPFPVTDDTVLGGVAFLVHHEAYHVGQLGLLRKGQGYPAMSYDRERRQANAGEEH